MTGRSDDTMIEASCRPMSSSMLKVARECAGMTWLTVFSPASSVMYVTLQLVSSPFGF